MKILNVTYKGVQTVGCVFRNTQYAEGHEQTYTYLVPEWCYPFKDDLAIVEKDGIYSIVTIVRVDSKSQIDVNAPFRYKWLVDVISTVAYDDLVKRENNFIQTSAHTRV